MFCKKMDEEQEDVKKMNDFLNKQKSSCQTNFQLEFQDFVNFKQYYSDQEYDYYFDKEDDSDDDSEAEEISIDSIKSPILSEEEESIINSCTDPELKRLLILNRSKHMQLIKLHKKIQEFLIECEDELEEKNYIMKNMESKQLYQQTFVWKLAAPYFKDKKFFPCPLNEDTMKKRAQNELNIYDLMPSPKWTPIEFDRLTNAVKCNYNINRQKDINGKIKVLKIKMQSEDCDDKANVEQILTLKNQLEDLKNDDTVPPLNSNEFINWYKVSETFLKDKHTPVECQSVWHMLIHPSINKSEWFDEENRNLEIIAERYEYQNWDQIATELNTNRTGFTTCLHYFSKLCDKFKKSKFTPEEDSFLLEVVDIYKIGNFIPWNKVVCHFSNRSRHQLYHRYTYFLSQNHVKRGKFSEAEDVLLLILVKKFGRNFKKCAEYMPHRSQIQLKSRYNSNLQRDIKKGTFTEEDDQLIYEYAQQYGEKNWSQVAKQLERCNAQIRHRYKLIKSFFHENPGAKVSDIPKRKHRFDALYEGQYNFLNYMAEQYNDVDFIPTLAMLEKNLQSGIMSSPSSFENNISSGTLKSKTKSIDAVLTDFFNNSVKIKQNNIVTESNLNEAAQNTEEVLRLLNVTLDIPKKLECDLYIDNVDVEILEKISENIGINQKKLEKLLPPNPSTLLGLRRLIIKHKEYKLKQKDKYDKHSWSIAQSLEELSEAERSEVARHRHLFAKRFDAIFNWSAVLSLEKPKQIDNITKTDITPSIASSIISNIDERSSKRPNSYDNKQTFKKRKIDVSELKNLGQQSKNCQLRVVDRSIIEKLIEKNNINIIQIENVTGQDGVVKSVLKQNYSAKKHATLNPSVINLTEGTSTTPERTPLSSNIEDIIIDDHHLHEDVERLDSMLKRVKSEVPNDSPTSSQTTEELQVIKGDVQLLKEILRYEKVKVKPDPDNYL